MAYFRYSELETTYLKERDTLLGRVIEKIGPVRREVTPDLFTALIQQIASQQISAKAAVTVCRRLTDVLGALTPERINAAGPQLIQQCGISMRKVSYMQALSHSVLDGSLDLARLHVLSDQEVCLVLSAIKGIGIWTAEMLMIFSMERPDIISYRDLAIQRGLRMLYRHRQITPGLFNRYKRRYHPYASVASLYLWEVASGRFPEFTDPAPLSPKKTKSAASLSTSIKKRVP